MHATPVVATAPATTGYGRMILWGPSRMHLKTGVRPQPASGRAVGMRYRSHRTAETRLYPSTLQGDGADGQASAAAPTCRRDRRARLPRLRRVRVDGDGVDAAAGG